MYEYRARGHRFVPRLRRNAKYTSAGDSSYTPYQVNIVLDGLRAGKTYDEIAANLRADKKFGRSGATAGTIRRFLRKFGGLKHFLEGQLHIQVAGGPLTTREIAQICDRYIKNDK